MRRITQQLDRLTHQSEQVAGEVRQMQANMNMMGQRQQEQDRSIGEIRQGIAGPQAWAGAPAHGAAVPGGAPPPAQPNGAGPEPAQGGNGNAGDGNPVQGNRPQALKPLRRDDGWRPLRTKKGYYEGLPMYGGKVNEWTSFSLKLRIALDEVYEFTASYLIWSSRLTAPLRKLILLNGLRMYKSARESGYMSFRRIYGVYSVTELNRDQPL